MLSSLYNEFYEGQEENWINFASEASLLRPSQSTVSWTRETQTAGARRLSAPPGGISPGAETQRGLSMFYLQKTEEELLFSVLF